MDIPVDNERCFACGPRSEIGLRLHFTAQTSTSVTAQTCLAEHFQGWVGVAHGGIVCMLLDEAMAHAAARSGRCAVTARINVRFRRPTPLDRHIHLFGEVLERRGTLIRLRATLSDTTGIVLASAEGDFLDRGPLDEVSHRRLHIESATR